LPLKQFFFYFTRYVLFSKFRQGPVLLAFGGLMLASFSLLVLQSTMGGLQKNVIDRQVAVLGHATLKLRQLDEDSVLFIYELVQKKYPKSFLEYEFEGMVRYLSYISPALVHGVDLISYKGKWMPSHLNQSNVRNKVFLETALPIDLAYKLEFSPPGELALFSPQSVDSFFMDIPRKESIQVGRVMSTDVPEIDQFHLWTDIRHVWNLYYEKKWNLIRIFNPVDKENFLSYLKNSLPPKLWEQISLSLWEDEFQALNYALKLESRVMFFLFASMGVLISLSISSGLYLFFSKTQRDLFSFWILGLSKRQLNRSMKFFVYALSISSILLGLFLATLFLLSLRKWGGELMPEVFVDRKIPILFKYQSYLFAFFIPSLISSIFIHWCLVDFGNELEKESSMVNKLKGQD